MSQITRLFTTATVAVAITVVVMLFVTRPASAQVGRTAVCTGTAQLGTPTWEKAEWMNAQLKSGKTQFVQINAMFCAW